MGQLGRSYGGDQFLLPACVGIQSPYELRSCNTIACAHKSVSGLGAQPTTYTNIVTHRRLASQVVTVRQRHVGVFPNSAMTSVASWPRILPYAILSPEPFTKRFTDPAAHPNIQSNMPLSTVTMNQLLVYTVSMISLKCVCTRCIACASRPLSVPSPTAEFVESVIPALGIQS